MFCLQYVLEMLYLKFSAMVKLCPHWGLKENRLHLHWKQISVTISKNLSICQAALQGWGWFQCSWNYLCGLCLKSVFIHFLLLFPFIHGLSSAISFCMCFLPHHSACPMCPPAFPSTSKSYVVPPPSMQASGLLKVNELTYTSEICFRFYEKKFCG